MQDMVGGDNNRTPVIFQGVDIFVFVGDVTTSELKTYASNRSFMVIWEDPRCCIWLNYHFIASLVFLASNIISLHSRSACNLTRDLGSLSQREL
jgi:hypothetical protein